MVARVTTSQRFSVALRNIQASLARTQQVQEQVVTGKQILRPSDDPAGFSKITSLRALLQDSIQFRKNINASTGALNVTDQTLASIGSLVKEARTLAIGQAGAPADATTRAATAAQVARIRESILELGNTQVGGRYIFAGTAVNTRAFTPDGIYRGNGESLKINLGIATPSTLNVTGSEFLTTGLSPDLYRTASYVKSTAPLTDRFVIDASNNVLVLQEFPSGTPFNVTLNAGTYTGDQLAAELQSQLTNFAAVAGTYEVTYGEDTDRFRIRVTGGTAAEFKVVSAGTNPASTAAAVFGFTADSVQKSETFSGSETAFNIIAGVNDTFSLQVDGSASVAVTVDAGVYTAETLASRIQLRINNNLKLVTASGNSIRILEDGGVRSATVTVPAGTKSGAVLAADLQASLNASTVLKGSTSAVPPGPGYTVVYNAAADKFTITVPGGPPPANLAVDTSLGGLAALMGYTEAVPFASVATSDTGITGAKVDFNVSFKDAFTITSPTVGSGSSVVVTGGAASILPTLSLAGAVTVASRSTRLVDLNKGKGVTAGSISVTNRAGQTVTVDLSTAVSLNDVFAQIEAAVTGVKASISSDGKRIVLTDTNSPKTSNLIVREVGTSTTAAGLGIKADVPGNLTGLDLDPSVSADTLVSALRGGAGVSLGTVGIGSASIDLAIGSEVTVGDVLAAVNANTTTGARASISADGSHLRLDSTDPAKSVLITDLSGSAAKELGFQGANNVLGLLSTFEEALRRNDGDTVGKTLDAFTEALERIGLARVKVGQVTQQFDRFKAQQEEVEVSFTEVLSKVEDTDIVEAMTRFSIFQNSLQAALASTAQILQVQLLDFLR